MFSLSFDYLLPIPFSFRHGGMAPGVLRAGMKTLLFISSYIGEWTAGGLVDGSGIPFFFFFSYFIVCVSGAVMMIGISEC